MNLMSIEFGMSNPFITGGILFLKILQPVVRISFIETLSWNIKCLLQMHLLDWSLTNSPGTELSCKTEMPN